MRVKEKIIELTDVFNSLKMEFVKSVGKIKS